jgi:hypothetical protein
LRKLLRLAALIVTSLLALAAFVVLLPGLKEGFSIAEVPLYAGGAAGLGALGAAWWFAGGRSLRTAALPLAILALPLVAYLYVIVDTGLAHLESARFARSLAIVGYKEARILWPGFDGPVGLTVTLDVSHGRPPRGALYAPELRMAPDASKGGGLFDRLTLGGGYFEPGDGAAPLAVLKEVLFRRPPRTAAEVSAFAPEGRSRVSFELLPGVINMMEGPGRFCLATSVPELPVCAAGQDTASGCVRPDRHRPRPPVYHRGGGLSAVWLFAGRNDSLADLSPQLTETLRRLSQMQGNAAAWTAMQQRLEPAGLARAGYGLCPPGPDSHTAYTVCYCR